MTRKETIGNLNMIRVAFIDTVTVEQGKLIDDTFRTAIKALRQEPCEDELDFVQEHKKISCNLIVEPCKDTISRSDMLDAIGHGTTYTSEELQGIIKGLPPVNPQPKTGHWIFDEILDRHYYCSECKSMGVDYWDFCPNCGCRMVEPQAESEGKK